MSEVTSGPVDHTEAQDEFDDSFRVKPDGETDPAGEAGWFLQRERERRGESLEVAGEATGVHPYHIEAIEFGDMTRMPARLEALEMIGIYAQYLGFDPNPLVRHYAHFLPRPAVAAKAQHPANPAPLSSAKVLRFGKMPKLTPFNFRLSGIPGGTGGLVAGLAGAIFLFAGASWIMMPDRAEPAVSEHLAASADPMPTASTGDDTAAIVVTDEPMPDDQQQADAAPAAASDRTAAADPATDDTAGTGLNGIGALIAEKVDTVKPKQPANAKTAKAAKSAKPAEAATEVASAEDVAVTPDGREFGAKNGGTRLMLKARAPVWVRVEDSQGKVVMTQMLMKGDTYRVPDRDGLVVIARDGGLLSYVIDGKEKGVLGTPGEILVGRSLDLKALQGNG